MSQFPHLDNRGRNRWCGCLLWLRHVGSCSPPPGKSWGVLPARHGRRSTRWQETRRPAWAPPPASVGLSRPKNQSDHEVHGSPSPLLAPTVEHNGTRFSWSVGSAQPRYSPKELNCTQSLLSSGLVSVSILNSTLDWGWDIQAQDKPRTCCLPLATHSHVLPAPCSLQ